MTERPRTRTLLIFLLTGVTRCCGCDGFVAPRVDREFPTCVSLQDRMLSTYLASKSNGSHSERLVSRRWNGNYKHASKKLCDVPKSKRINLELSVQHCDGSVTTKTLLKKRQETLQHVLTKAVLWKLHCDEYPGVEIEQNIDDPDYLPDVISLNSTGYPLFWGEAGRMKVHKAIDLMTRYPGMHIVHCRWDMTLSEIEAPLMEHLQALVDADALGTLPNRSGRFDFCTLPLDVWRFIDEDTGFIHITKDDVEWKELIFPESSSDDGLR